MIDATIHACRLLNMTLKIVQTQNNTKKMAQIKMFMNGLYRPVTTLTLISIISWSI